MLVRCAERTQAVALSASAFSLQTLLFSIASCLLSNMAVRIHGRLLDFGIIAIFGHNLGELVASAVLESFR